MVTIAGEDITSLNLSAIYKRIAKARRPVRFDFESGEGADLLANAFDDESDEEDEEENIKKQKSTKADGKKDNKNDLLKTIRKNKNVKKAGGLFSWGRKKNNKKKVAPEK